MKPKYLLPAIFSFILIILLPLLLYNKGSGTSEPNTTLSPSLTFINPHYNRNVSVATGVSDDGSVVVGYSVNANEVNIRYPKPKTDSWESQRGFIWTSSSGARDLGSLGLERTRANAVSGDGKVVVGFYYTGSYSQRAFRWSADSGMKDLGTLGIDWVEAFDVSKDGSVIVGYSCASGWAVYGFRWTEQTGMVKLDTLPGYRFASAQGVSEDGAKIAGLAIKDAAPDSHITQAVIWTSSGIRGLGSISNWYSQGLGISADGSTVIGILHNGTWPDPYLYPYRSFIWQEYKGMRVIETLGGNRTWVFHAVTRYGTEVFGASQNSNGEWRAFVWSENEGIRDLNLIYKDIIPSGWVLRAVYDCSPDGRFLVGMAEGPSGVIRAFLLDRKVTAPTQTSKP
jgi:probable HAF family extracellular repeat protein